MFEEGVLNPSRMTNKVQDIVVPALGVNGKEAMGPTSMQQAPIATISGPDTGLQVQLVTNGDMNHADLKSRRVSGVSTGPMGKYEQFLQPDMIKCLNPMMIYYSEHIYISF